MANLFNFDNIGTKIKNFAKWSCWISIILVWIGCAVMFVFLVADGWMAHICGIPLVAAVVTPFILWIGSWILYAFGETVENIQILREEKGFPDTTDAPAPQTPCEKRSPHPTAVTKTAYICQCGKLFYGDTCPNCGREAVRSKAEASSSTKLEDVEDSNTVYCTCGAVVRGRYCPACGKSVK